MLKTDPQLKSNDCGISAIKTIFNVFEKNISRKYIEDSIILEENGSRITDLKIFFDNHGFASEFKLLDINFVSTDNTALDDFFPFILPIENKSETHYVVVNERKGNKLLILDPNQGTQYYLSIQELKKQSHFSKTSWDLVTTDQKIKALCSQDLEAYGLKITTFLNDNDQGVLFNKLTYFTYLKQNFGFKDAIVEKAFLVDLLKNQEISSVPKHFRTLKYNQDKINISAPIILCVKELAITETAELPKDNTPNLYLQLYKQLAANKKLWHIYIFAALFSATSAQLAVFINQILIDNVLPSYNINTLVIFAIGIGVYKLFDIGTSLYKSFVGIHLGNILDKHFLNTFDQKINAFSLPYIHSYKKGDLIERISDSMKLKTFFLRFFTSILVDVVVSIYSLGILFYINYKIAIIVLVVMLLFWGWFRFITPYIKQNERIRYIRKADFLSKMIEKIEGIQVIKSFKIEQYHSNKITASINKYLKIQLKNGYLDLVNKVIISVIIVVSSILIMVFLTKLAINDHSISLGQIITFIALSSKIFSSLRSILEENLSLQENEVILKRNLDFAEAQKANSNRGIVDFNIEKLNLKDLNFGYFEDEMVLNNINFEIKKTDKIQIEGQNGSGKSTLSKVLTALYTPKSGAILINDCVSNLYSSEKLKDKILLVSNEDILFNDTLEDNICLGKKINRNDIIALSKKIDFYDFIASKVETLDFTVSENGKNLSTGQRKKVLLMRALLSNAEIIILDEVLSGMDLESRNKIEQLIQDDGSKCFIIISHEPINNIKFTKKYKINNGHLNLI